jgi:hypothetical protein
MPFPAGDGREMAKVGAGLKPALFIPSLARHPTIASIGSADHNLRRMVPITRSANGFDDVPPAVAQPGDRFVSSDLHRVSN